MKINQNLNIFNLQELRVTKSQAELVDRGKRLQKKFPVAKLAEYVPVDRDPLALINSTESRMIPALLPLRNQRMAASPFSFYRGTAELMENDLADQASSGINVVISGDAHINNYGFYASPERKLLFDLNDFDESRIGHWEDDLRRLLVSVYLAGDQNGISAKDLLVILREVAKTYRHGIRYANALSLPERFYFSYEIHDMINAIHQINIENTAQINTILAEILKKSPKRNSAQVVKKLTVPDVNGQLHFIEQAPRASRVDQATYHNLVTGYREYRQHAREDVQVYLANFNLTDAIRYSVGVGSFGTRCYLLLLTGNDGSHLVLQIKEALPLRATLADVSADPATRLAQGLSAGRRIVTAQRTLQSASDPFLSATQFANRSYYVRQFRDMKESIDVTKLDQESFLTYGETCAFLLAIAHFQSPTAPLIAGYLHHQKALDAGMADWAVQYAGQVLRDYHRFLNK